MDVWELLENAPEGCEAISDLYSWSTNYDAGDGPFSLFLDMIGWSGDNLDTSIYGPTVRMRDQLFKIGTEFQGTWDANLGYVELSKLGAALTEYADRPQNVREYVDALMEAEIAE